MHILIHGDDHIRSRNELVALKDNARLDNKEIIILNGETIDLSDLKQALEAKSLFALPRFVIIENLFSRRISKDKNILVQFIQKFFDPDVDLIVWEKKEVKAGGLKKLPKNWLVKKYKLPAELFNLLDSMKDHNTAQVLQLFNSCQKQSAPELIFFMLVRRIRELIIAKDLGKEELSGAPWQIGKLLSQAKTFSLAKLIKIYNDLLNIEYKVKSGQSKMPLDWHLDMLFSTI